MTPPKTIDQVRDEMADEYADEYSELCCDIAFKSGFNASTKYHETDRDRLAKENQVMKEALKSIYKDAIYNDMDNLALKVVKTLEKVSDDRQD